MDLQLDAEQRLIVDSAAEFLAANCTSAHVRAVMASGMGWDQALWQGVSDLGWCGIHLPERFQGTGLGFVELCLLQEQLGRRLACIPFFDSVVLTATALGELCTQAFAGEALMALAQGGVRLSFALPDAGAKPDATALRDGEDWILSGQWNSVGSAQLSHHLMLPALDANGQLLLFWVPAGTSGLNVAPLESLDATRIHGLVTAQLVRLSADQCIARGQDAQSAMDRTRCIAAIGLAAEQVGVAQQALDLTVSYVGDRHQFEKPVASFQAVKHRCAEMLVAVETARSAVYGAACIVDSQPEAQTLLRLAAQARHQATEAALFCTREAIQLHGGVGFTWEYDPHLYFRRAQASAQRLGHLRWWNEQVAHQLLD